MLLESLDNPLYTSSIFVIGIASSASVLDASLLQPGIEAPNSHLSFMEVSLFLPFSLTHSHPFPPSKMNCRPRLSLGRLEVIIPFSFPGGSQRRMILERLLSRLPLCNDEEDDTVSHKSSAASSLLDDLARRTRGYGGSDLSHLCSEALACSCRRRRRHENEGKFSPSIILLTYFSLIDPSLSSFTIMPPASSNQCLDSDQCFRLGRSLGEISST